MTPRPDLVLAIAGICLGLEVIVLIIAWMIRDRRKQSQHKNDPNWRKPTPWG